MQQYVLPAHALAPLAAIPLAAPVELPERGLWLSIEGYALTANNVSYAVLGERMGYWRFFPAPAGQGCVPVWGHATVLASHHPEISVGERLYGFLPMASHALLIADRVRPDSLVDASPHRVGLPAVYQHYRRLAAGSADLAADALEAVLRPLYSTAWLLAALAAGGADATLILTSASSKTALATAALLRGRAGAPRLLGLSSAGRVDSVRATGLYDEVQAYDELAALLAPIQGPVVIYDYAGAAAVRGALHAALTDRLRASWMIGLTHHEAMAAPKALPGPAPQLYFAPSHWQQLAAEVGARELEAQMAADWPRLLAQAAQWFRIERGAGGAAMAAVWAALVDGRVSADQAWVLAPLDAVTV
ncbi:MAG: DUF2855 family protein [Xanthomonadales bacterium]|nr:DUF2855 family protein [Xanthomonadales bacterium]